MRVFALISQNLISAALFPPLAWPPLGRSTDPHSRMASRVEFDRAPEAYPASSSSSNAHRWRLQFFWLTTTFHGAIGHAYLFLLITFLQLFVIVRTACPVWIRLEQKPSRPPRDVAKIAEMLKKTKKTENKLKSSKVATTALTKMVSLMLTLIWHENRFEQKKQKMSIANNKGHNPCSDLARLYIGTNVHLELLET